MKMLLTLFFAMIWKIASAAVIVDFVSTSSTNDGALQDTGHAIYDFRVKLTAFDSDVYFSATNAFDAWFVNSVTGTRVVPFAANTTITSLNSLPVENGNFLILDGFSYEFRVRTFFLTRESNIFIHEKLNSFEWKPSMGATYESYQLEGFESNTLYFQGVTEPSTSLLGLLGVLGLMRRRR